MELKRIAHKLTVCKVADISEINIIKGGAFDGCAALKTIAIPDSVKEIGTMESGIFESRIVITGGV